MMEKTEWHGASPKNVKYKPEEILSIGDNPIYTRLVN